MTLDTTAFDRAFALFMKHSRRDAKLVLKEQAKLLTRDCAKLTPPFSKTVFGNPAAEPFSAQLKIGEKAVKNQIASLYYSVKQLDIVKNPRNPEVKAATTWMIEQGNFEVFKNYIKSEKVQNWITATASEKDHRKFRDRRGRVRKRVRVAVFFEDTIDILLQLKLSHVGKAKAGWKTAAAKFGVSLPGWITRHSTAGSATDDTENPTNPSITIQNLIPYASELASDPETRIIQRALAFRARAMIRQVENYMNKHAARFSL